MLKVILTLSLVFGTVAYSKSTCKAPNIHKMNPGKVIVAVLDTGLDLKDERYKDVLCKGGHRDFSGYGIKDIDGHGTHISGIIRSYNGDRGYCLVIVKYFHDEEHRDNYKDAFNYTVALKPDLVNISSVGVQYMKSEYLAIKNNPSIKFVVAAGNEGVNIDGVKRYPASYNLPNVFTVGNALTDGYPNSHSNYGNSVGYWEEGTKVWSDAPDGKMKELTGTSMAAAVKSAKILKGLVNEKRITFVN